MPQLAHPGAQQQSARPPLQARLQVRSTSNQIIATVIVWQYVFSTFPYFFPQERGANDGSPLPPQLLRAYIRYARAYCRPVLSDAAKSVLQDFYVQLRSAAVGTDGIPITVVGAASTLLT